MGKQVNPIWAGLRLGLGEVSQDCVIKIINGKPVICKKPDMSKVKPSRLQLKSNDRFKAAIAFARSIVGDPAKKGAYKCRPGMGVYHSAVKDYMESH